MILWAVVDLFPYYLFNVYLFFFVCLFVFFFCFLGPHLWHMEVPKLGVEMELQLPAYTTATATQDPSHVWDLHRSSRQHWILNPLSRGQGWNQQPHGY